ncbi:MAG TPA: selenocysteine-specific translation elongation factor [Pyrinomonadaceae bacterium]|nr:selenocysteine-specific translation elongation factor [Pyrinomonadaceae bacterium]
MHSIIIGTAGHIDHGKSSLVQSLTGKDPDRLPEEKRRGITIDLGFADIDLGDVRVGFVDVPGHEKFVKNMLAGVHGIDAVALVIAADEGVMPQTREHFDICRLLGVQKGLVALTKTDLIEDELLALVEEEAKELVAGSFLEGGPVVAVSARTGKGLEEFRDSLRTLASDLPPRSSDYVTRLPIDRAFTMKGFGPVVTGTLISGSIAEGEELELLPLGRRVRARGVQVYGAAVNRAEPGQRTAVNLAGVEVGEIERGMVLAQPGRLASTQIINTHLNLLPSAPRPVRTRSRLRVHLGSAEVLARVRVLNNRGEVAPGESAFVQFRLEAPVVTIHGDRFIVRSYSPAETVAGGIVLDPLAAKHRGRELAKTQQRLQALMDLPRPAKLAEFVTAAGDAGLRVSNLAARTGWNDEVLSESLDAATQEQTIIEAEGTYLASDAFQRLSRLTVEAVNAHHQKEPLARGLARETLRDRVFAHVPPEIFRAVVSRLENEGVLATDKDLVRSREHTLELSAEDTQLRERMFAIIQSAGLEAPSLDQLMEASGVGSSQRAHGRKILQLLLDSGKLVRVQNEFFYDAEAVENLKQLLRNYGSEHEPDRLIDVAAFKDLAGVSRKYAIPLLEYLDLTHVTRRAGDKRIISK